MPSPFRASAKRICWCRRARASASHRTAGWRSSSADGAPSCGRAFSGIGRAVLISALLIGCTPSPEKTSEEALPLPTPPPAQPAPAPTLRTDWTFSSQNDQCVATAAAGATALHVTVRRESPIRLDIALAPKFGHDPAVPLRFVGPAGTWQVTAHQVGTTLLSVTLGSDNIALSHVLVLLSGGTLDVGTPPQAVVVLAIRASDTNGQNWFDCAREKLL